MSLAAAVVSRWDDASLDSSIAIISRGSPDLVDFGAVPEDLASKDLPRAEFVLEDDTPREQTVAYRIRSAILTFRVYHTSGATLETLLTSIEDNFDNAENAASNPMSLSASFGTLLCCDYTGPRTVEPVGEGIFLGTVVFRLRWTKDRVTPS